MTELTILGLVEMYPKLGLEETDMHANEEKKIWLKSEFKEWMKTDEFKKLREGFVPATDDTAADNTDNTETKENREQNNVL